MYALFFRASLTALLFLSLLPRGLAQYATELTVAADGSGDYSSIQAAIDDAKSFPDRRITIFIKNGTYREKVRVHAWNTLLTLRGESREGVIITYDDYFDRIGRGRNSTFHTPTLLVQGNDFRAENLTIVNSAGPIGQAIALSVEADRVAVVDCTIKGHQDTLYVAGEGFRQYFRNCYIEGTTDYIFGAATAVFEDCHIHSLADSYITAASTPAGIAHGLVFIDCRLTAAPGVSKVYLGRPWRDYARTAFLHTEMGNHILAEGWDNWNTPAREQTTYYAEHASSGPGARPRKRVGWAHTLSRRQAGRYSPERILGEWVK